MDRAVVKIMLADRLPETRSFDFFLRHRELPENDLVAEWDAYVTRRTEAEIPADSLKATAFAAALPPPSPTRTAQKRRVRARSACGPTRKTPDRHLVRVVDGPPHTDPQRSNDYA